MSATDPRSVARIYQDTKDRVTSLVTDLDEAALSTTVTACPGRFGTWWHISRQRPTTWVGAD